LIQKNLPLLSVFCWMDKPFRRQQCVSKDKGNIIGFILREVCENSNWMSRLKRLSMP
jgi:hypothetical protein